MAVPIDLMDVDAWKGGIFTGRWIPGEAIRQVVNPATGEQLGIAGLAGVADVDSSLEIADQAWTAWARVSAGYRAAVVRRAAAVLEAEGAAVEWWLIREAGSVRAKARAEVQAAVQICWQAAALAERQFGEVIRSAAPRHSLVRHVPLGVIGVITPYNMPLLLAMRCVAPALALGNAVALKPDPRTVVSGGVALARVFERARLPRGVLQVLAGDAAIGERIVADPRVRAVAFTGSTTAGRAVAQLGAKHLKRVMPELGGNSALLVLDDADLELAVQTGAYGSFLHQGQVCMASGRHLVPEKMFDRYVTRLAEVAEGLTVGDPSAEVALGPLIDATQRDRVHGLVTQSVAAGAKLLTGGSYSDLFYRPTVLAEPEVSTPAFEQEVFGPVAPVRPFRTVSDAVELINASESGLAVSIMTRSLDQGLAIADRVRAGMVHINDPTVDHEPGAPFGGFGSSGTGWRFGGSGDLHAFTEMQWLTLRGQAPRMSL